VRNFKDLAYVTALLELFLESVSIVCYADVLAIARVFVRHDAALL